MHATSLILHCGRNIKTGQLGSHGDTDSVRGGRNVQGLRLGRVQLFRPFHLWLSTDYHAPWEIMEPAPGDHGERVEHCAGHARDPRLREQRRQEVGKREQRGGRQPQQRQHDAEAGVREGVVRDQRAEQAGDGEGGEVAQRPRAPVGAILHAGKAHLSAHRCVRHSKALRVMSGCPMATMPIPQTQSMVGLPSTSAMPGSTRA